MPATAWWACGAPPARMTPATRSPHRTTSRAVRVNMSYYSLILIAGRIVAICWPKPQGQTKAYSGGVGYVESAPLPWAEFIVQWCTGMAPEKHVVVFGRVP